MSVDMQGKQRLGIFSFEINCICVQSRDDVNHKFSITLGIEGMGQSLLRYIRNSLFPVFLLEGLQTEIGKHNKSNAHKWWTQAKNLHISSGIVVMLGGSISCLENWELRICVLLAFGSLGFRVYVVWILNIVCLNFGLCMMDFEGLHRSRRFCKGACCWMVKKVGNIRDGSWGLHKE